eukprot:CAMPEP_0178428384 /NCGR_PEP_ID=MMETSP0689_2-20121128/30250_1 /TAXON_ID=160604 /ORGANISM="Amphidinium massartii, Strain CS-259" /LENGTH=62 /DNA_ID=CAMNT_0020050155 /DNA_START=774 /DNA_END=962 /DNA_ORIENTATION=+
MWGGQERFSQADDKAVSEVVVGQIQDLEHALVAGDREASARSVRIAPVEPQAPQTELPKGGA